MGKMRKTSLSIPIAGIQYMVDSGENMTCIGFLFPLREFAIEFVMKHKYLAEIALSIPIAGIPGRWASTEALTC